jgi:hypothetical protein
VFRSTDCIVSIGLTAYTGVWLFFDLVGVAPSIRKDDAKSEFETLPCVAQPACPKHTLPCDDCRKYSIELTVRPGDDSPVYDRRRLRGTGLFARSRRTRPCKELDKPQPIQFFILRVQAASTSLPIAGNGKRPSRNRTPNPGDSWILMRSSLARPTIPADRPRTARCLASPTAVAG